MADRVLIKGGTVLSLDRAVGNTVEADVLIEDGIIAEVGTSLRARGADVVDAADTIVMPGFVDAHRHLWQSLTGDLGADVRRRRVGALHTRRRLRRHADRVAPAPRGGHHHRRRLVRHLG